MRRPAAWAPLLLLLAALAAPACTPRPRPPVEIAFWQFWPAETVDPLLRRFESENPRLRVRMRRLEWDTGPDTIAAAIASGRVPDLCELGSDSLPGYLSAAVLSDWSAGVASLRDSLRGWELCTLGETVYGLPWLLDTRALFWSPELFARAGLDPARPPETWDELRRAAAAIQRLGHGVHGYGVVAEGAHQRFPAFMPYAWGDGGAVLSAGLDSALFDSPENLAALEFYLSLRAVGMRGTQEALDREFVEGRLGLEVAGQALLDRIAREHPGRQVAVARMPRPAPDRGTNASFATGEVLASFRASRHKEEALRLARFLSRPENLLAIARSARRVQPATAGADTMLLYRDVPGGRTFVVQAETARFAPAHPRWAEMEAAIEDEITQAVDDRKSPAQAVADAQVRIAALVRRR